MAGDVYNINQYLGLGEVDSTGTPLPGNFNSLSSDNAYAWDGAFPLTKTEVVVVVDVGTFTRVTTYTNDGTNVTTKTTGIWVKS